MFPVDLSDPVIVFALSIAVIFWGLCLGSFTTAIIPREMEGVSWFSLRGEKARSHCAVCHKQLSWRELIPIISYIKQKQKCACGKNKIPIFYPITESIILCLTIILFYKFGFSILSIGITLSLPFFATCFWMGYKSQPITDRILIVLSFIAVGTIFLTITDKNLFHAIYGALGVGCVGFVTMLISHKFSSRKFLSWDIIKLWVIIGFWLGISSVGYFLFLMGVGGALWILFPPKTFKDKPQSFPYTLCSLLVFFVLMVWL
jgi:leader peptidase (prepilin peptidase)/N-methyltransferase